MRIKVMACDGNSDEKLDVKGLIDKMITDAESYNYNSF